MLRCSIIFFAYISYKNSNEFIRQQRSINVLLIVICIYVTVHRNYCVCATQCRRAFTDVLLVVKPKNRPGLARPGHVNITLLNTVVDFH